MLPRTFNNRPIWSHCPGESRSCLEDDGSGSRLLLNRLDLGFVLSKKHALASFVGAVYAYVLEAFLLMRFCVNNYLQCASQATFTLVRLRMRLCDRMCHELNEFLFLLLCNAQVDCFDSGR